ncbi:hypothetical protein F8178_03340 [Haloechinothrix sp. LS1_15]|nr:hypothetical protein [Haloechinothrix sp. LS1_15]
MALCGAFGSALALTGAAFFTVQQSACDEPGMYVRYDSHVQLIGGCVDPDGLPTEPREEQDPSALSG